MEDFDFTDFLLAATSFTGGTGTTGGTGDNKGNQTMMQKWWWMTRLAILGGFRKPHRPQPFGVLNPQYGHAQS